MVIPKVRTLKTQDHSKGLLALEKGVAAGWVFFFFFLVCLFLVLFGVFFPHFNSALLPLSGGEIVSALCAQEGLLISLV